MCLSEQLNTTSEPHLNHELLLLITGCYFYFIIGSYFIIIDYWLFILN